MIVESKTRSNITMTKELKSKLDRIAAEENRSFNNLVVTILEQYVKSNSK